MCEVWAGGISSFPSPEFDEILSSAPIHLTNESKPNLHFIHHRFRTDYTTHIKGLPVNNVNPTKVKNAHLVAVYCGG